jgi:hypothetical protein
MMSRIETGNKKTPTKVGVSLFIWRREWDLNPR